MKTFRAYTDLPQCTELGFKVVKCPPHVWNIIKELYSVLRHVPTRESWEGIEDIITGETNPDLMSLHRLPTIQSLIHKELKGLHEAWSGMELELQNIYGIRSYNHNSTLVNHRDIVQTHHISSIIIVDKKLDGAPDWPLDIQDHDGNWHKIYANPGDLILYESARCMHGRMETFQGDWFRNFYVHYKFKNWHYSGGQI